MTRPASTYLLLLLLLFLGASGLAGGLSLALDPTGMGLAPGLFLMGVGGVVPLGVTALVVRGSGWAWSASLMVGLTLLAWLYVEILVVGYLSSRALRLVYGVVGLAIVVLTLFPSVRRDLRGDDEGMSGPPGHSDAHGPEP